MTTKNSLQVYFLFMDTKVFVSLLYIIENKTMR